jgi:hypothetical protein
MLCDHAKRSEAHACTSGFVLGYNILAWNGRLTQSMMNTFACDAEPVRDAS